MTNEIYKTWSGMKANEYKAYKEIRKKSLRDNMNNLEVLLTDIGELTTKELAKEYRPYRLEENKKIARIGGKIAKNTRNDIEEKLQKTIVSKENHLNYCYEEVDNKIANL